MAVLGERVVGVGVVDLGDEEAVVDVDAGAAVLGLVEAEDEADVGVAVLEDDVVEVGVPEL